jgi:hypothetical protein
MQVCKVCKQKVPTLDGDTGLCYSCNRGDI